MRQKGYLERIRVLCIGFFALTLALMLRLDQVFYRSHVVLTLLGDRAHQVLVVRR